MQLLGEIHHSKGVNIHGRTIHRHAVRAVILRGQELLMIYSTKVGDYKFPGGGVNDGETHQQALIREVKEECGMSLLPVGNEICRVVEYDLPVEQAYDVFKMSSYYLIPSPKFVSLHQTPICGGESCRKTTIYGGQAV
jgi:8-oxo-dGTP pyrophosphatase MutT (NUDIX family)